jgi:crotonobetainyl-CoA:carnitine CoA-transferase CaiB-like acyl-CoA transferase
MHTILNGIKILDLTRIIAGPLCTQNFADLGATVFKIERPGEGDDTRRMGPFMRDAHPDAPANESATFLAYNRGKHSVCVDIASPEGAALIRDLAAQCDVLVENFKVGDLRKYGLDYESVRAVRPDIVYCSITGFGQDGPYAPRPAYDFILQGMAGPMSTCGRPDGEPGAGPMRASIPVTDIVTGLYATVAIMGALYHRRDSGRGQHIDMSLLDAAVAFNGHLAVGYLLTGNSPTRAGNNNPIAAPADVYPCRDGYLIIAAGNNKQFTALCGALGLEALPHDARFASNTARIANRGALQDQLLPRVAEVSRAELFKRLESAGVPCGPINTMAEVFADPQTRHRGLEIELPHASGALTRLVRSPIRLSETPVQHRPVPMLGEHSEQVLRDELGLTQAQIQGLRDRAII